MFQLPWIPEIFMLNWDVKAIEQMLGSVLTPDEVWCICLSRNSTIAHVHFIHFVFRIFSRPLQVEYYKYTISQPGALTAMLNYYRALPRAWLKKAKSKVTVPTLVVWGEKDTALSKQLNNNLERWVPKLHLVYVPKANHWVQQASLC
jgi:epoxide hydrolase 4